MLYSNKNKQKKFMKEYMREYRRRKRIHMVKRDKFGRDIEKYRAYQREYMREYRRRKKAELEELLTESYDPFMDAYVISREKLKEII